MLAGAFFALGALSSLADHASEWRAARKKGKGRGRGRGSRGRAGKGRGALYEQHVQFACSNTCASARNGRCEDGSVLASTPMDTHVHEIFCDYGTDCEDCGRLPRLPPPAPLGKAMPAAPHLPPAYQQRLGTRATGVALLRERKVKVQAAWTRTQPSFLMPFTDPSHDIDVSRSMASSLRAVEPLYNLYWHRLCADCCAKGGLMLDVGANFGYYSLLAARMGCRVVAWEPVPVFRAFVETAAALNNLTHRIHLRSAVVSDVPGVRINLTVPLKGIWGTASVNGLNVDPSVPSAKYMVGAVSETLDQVVRERPCILKLDVEGYEPSVLKGAASFLKVYPPAAILTEYTPGVMERIRQWQRLPEYPASLRMLKSAGYTIWHLFGTGKNMDFGLKTDWRTAPLPPLAQVTERVLRAEETNARNMLSDNSMAARQGGAGGGGQRGAGVVAGFAIPWDLHPRSLHAEFSHNTDLFLTLDPKAVPFRREVGITEHTRFGLGGGFCEHVLRDGTALEMIGRLCVQEGRNASIERAIAIADQPRPIRYRQSWHAHVTREGRLWAIEGPMRTSRRKMVRRAATKPGGGRLS